MRKCPAILPDGFFMDLWRHTVRSVEEIAKLLKEIRTTGEQVVKKRSFEDKHGADGDNFDELCEKRIIELIKSYV